MRLAMRYPRTYLNSEGNLAQLQSDPTTLFYAIAKVDVPDATDGNRPRRSTAGQNKRGKSSAAAANDDDDD